MNLLKLGEDRVIVTARLQLIPIEQQHREAFARGKSVLGAALNVTVPHGWPQFAEAYLPFAAESGDSAASEWQSYFFIHQQEKVLVGSGGFYGEPDAESVVEIGYEIATEYWNKGFGTESVRGLINYAFAHEAVQAVRAHTLAEPNASNRLLQKVGMRHISSHVDPDVGQVWRWQINRQTHEQRGFLPARLMWHGSLY
ncbi:MAG: GNAT family N-acetyltransferase [Anaerolineae bacterium]